LDLVLVRHGVTELNAARIFMGHGPVPLAPLGREQIARLGERLRGTEFRRFVSSDILRTRESAEILSAAIGMPFETNAGLREVDPGDAVGVGYEDAARRWPEVFLPEGVGRFPNGESFADVADRTSAFLREQVIDEAPGRVLAVTHGGVVRGVTARLLGLPLQAVASFLIDNASLTVFRIDARGISLVTWNDTAHLGPATATPATGWGG
jgi:probable phosphoglycerate mutase